MKPQKVLHLFFCFCFFISSSISTAATTQRLGTLDSILEKAAQNSLTVKKADSKITEMSDNLDLARSNYYPNLSVVTSGYSHQVLLNQKIYDGGNTFASVDLYKSQKQAAQWDKKKENESLRDRVVEAYYDGLFTLQQKSLLDNNAKLVAEAVAAAEKQVKFRAIGRDTLLRVRVEYRKGQANVLQAKNSVELAERRLILLLRDPDFSLSSLSERMEFRLLPKPIDRSKANTAEEIFENSPTMQWLHTNESILEAQKSLDLSSERPQFSFIASYGDSQTAPPMTVNYVYQPGFNVGLQLTLPLFSGFSSFARKRVYGEKKYQLSQDLQNERSNFSFEIRRRIDNLQQDWSDLQMIRKEITASEEVFREIDRTYHYGLASPELWFQSRAALETWSLRELQKLRDYWVGHQKLTDLLKANE